MVTYYKEYKTGEYSVILTDGSHTLELECDDIEGAREVINTILGNCKEINVSTPEVE